MLFLFHFIDQAFRVNDFNIYG